MKSTWSSFVKDDRGNVVEFLSRRGTTTAVYAIKLKGSQYRSLPVAYRNLSPVFEGMTGAMAQIKFAKCSSVRVISS